MPLSTSEKSLRQSMVDWSAKVHFHKIDLNNVPVTIFRVFFFVGLEAKNIGQSDPALHIVALDCSLISPLGYEFHFLQL